MKILIPFVVLIAICACNNYATQTSTIRKSEGLSTSTTVHVDSTKMMSSEQKSSHINPMMLQNASDETKINLMKFWDEFDERRQSKEMPEAVNAWLLECLQQDYPNQNLFQLQARLDNIKFDNSLMDTVFFHAYLTYEGGPSTITLMQAMCGSRDIAEKATDFLVTEYENDNRVLNAKKANRKNHISNQQTK